MAITPTIAPPIVAFDHSGIGMRSNVSSAKERVRMKATAMRPATIPATMYGPSSKGLAIS